MKTVFVLDDHELVRRGLTDLLQAEDDLDVVGGAATAREALERVPCLHPDVAVLDVRLPDGNGVEVCRELRADNADLACVMLTSFSDDQTVVEAAIAGAAGFVLKQVGGNELIDTIRRAANGELLLDESLFRAATCRLEDCVRNDPLRALTVREKSLLVLLSQGMTNRQIAAEVFLSENTVRNYVSNILMKLGMARRTEAAVFATRLAEHRRAVG